MGLLSIVRTAATHDFFNVGGALEPDAPSYVVRQADDELMQAVLSGHYCNVLAARQMGQSRQPILDMLTEEKWNDHC